MKSLFDTTNILVHSQSLKKPNNLKESLISKNQLKQLKTMKRDCFNLSGLHSPITAEKFMESKKSKSGMLHDSNRISREGNQRRTADEGERNEKMERINSMKQGLELKAHQ